MTAIIADNGPAPDGDGRGVSTSVLLLVVCLATADVHRLAVTVLTVDVPAVQVLVTDPEKSDG